MDGMAGQTRRGQAALRGVLRREPARGVLRREPARGVLRREPAVLAALFAVYAVVAVAWMALLVPPFCNADETAHFLRADQVASGVLVAPRPGGTADLGIGEVAARFDRVRSHAEIKVGADLLDAARVPDWGRTGAMGFPNTAVYPPTGYLPAVAAILAGKRAGWRIAATLTASRLVNGAVCIAVGGAAIAFSGGMAVLLFTILCLPMSLSLFATVSQDGVLLAAAALAVAALVRARERQAKRIWTWLLCVCLCVVAMGKPIYLPLAIVPLGMGWAPWPRRLACTAAVAAAVLAWSLWCAAPILAATGRPQGVHPAGQVAWLLGHKAMLYQVPATVLAHQWADGLPYLRQFVGVLGWLDVSLPGAYTLAAWGVIALAVALARPGQQDSAARLLVLAAAVASCLAIFVIQYLTWTQVGSHLVEGVQGRYFLPPALFLPLALQGRAWRWRRPACVLIAAFPALSIAVAVRALVHRYYA